MEAAENPRGIADDHEEASVPTCGRESPRHPWMRRPTPSRSRRRFIIPPLPSLLPCCRVRRREDVLKRRRSASVVVPERSSALFQDKAPRVCAPGIRGAPTPPSLPRRRRRARVAESRDGSVAKVPSPHSSTPISLPRRRRGCPGSPTRPRTRTHARVPKSRRGAERLGATLLDGSPRRPPEPPQSRAPPTTLATSPSALPWYRISVSSDAPTRSFANASSASSVRTPRAQAPAPRRRPATAAPANPSQRTRRSQSGDGSTEPAPRRRRGGLGSGPA